MTTNTQSRGQWTSASNAVADSLCPGRFLAQRGLPEPEQTEDAKYGTMLHEAVAKNETAGLSAVQKDLFETCLQIIDRTGAQFFGPNWEQAKAKPFIEQRYWVQVGRNGAVYQHSGQCDRVYRHGPAALIFEIKSLAGEILASPENLQLRDQAVLVKGHFLVDQVATVVVQPLVTHSPKVCVYDKNDLRRAEQEMFARVARSHDPAQPRIPGDVQCKFCRAKGVCGEYQRWAASKLPVPVSIIDTPVSQWSEEQCATFLSGHAIAKAWLDETHQAMKDRLRAKPASIPGYQLKDGYDRFDVNNPQELFSRFEALGGKLEAFMTCLNVGNTKFKELVHTVTGKNGKPLKELIKKLTEGIVDTKKTASTIERIKQ